MAATRDGTPTPGPEELVVLVDAHDAEIGTAEKLRAHRDGVLHRAVSVFVFDRSGAVLLQQRAADKYHSGGLWSNACCGHPRPGEPAIDAARRRLREEMGIECALEPAFTFTYRADLEGGLVEHELDHVFVGWWDADPVPNVHEVHGWRWVDVAHLRADLAAHPGRYTAWLGTALEGVLARLGEPRRAKSAG